MSGVEPDEPVVARLRLEPKPEAAARPRLCVSFLLDASASMHQFQLDPQQRAHWRSVAEARGELRRQMADGRESVIWTGQTLRELQSVVSTPMLSTLRGMWRGLQALQPTDPVSVVAFAEHAQMILDDRGEQPAPVRMEGAKNALAVLGSGVDQSGLGRDTRLEQALRLALEGMVQVYGPGTVRRMVLVSDGVIADRDACVPLVEQAVEQNLVISVIGVGEEFDEEFLMRVADSTRGNYYYAPTARDVEQALAEEFQALSHLMSRQASIRVEPLGGTVFRDLLQASPTVSTFPVMWEENGAYNFVLGDLSATGGVDLLLQLAPPALTDGESPICRVAFQGLAPGHDTGFDYDGEVRLLATTDQNFLRTQDDTVMDAVRRVEVFIAERKAQSAKEKGDTESATRHLKAATRMLRNMNREDLAADMEAAADDASSGTRNLGREKAIKAGTRRLGRDRPST